MRKILGIVLAFLLALTSVSAIQSNDYFIDTVKIKGEYAYGAIVLERGETVPIEVWVNGINTVDGVRVKASLSGYEFEDVEVETTFGTEAGVFEEVFGADRMAGI